MTLLASAAAGSGPLLRPRLRRQGRRQDRRHGGVSEGARCRRRGRRRGVCAARQLLLRRPPQRAERGHAERASGNPCRRTSAFAIAGLPSRRTTARPSWSRRTAARRTAPPFITLNNNSTLKGVVIYYPEQDPAEEPSAYPWAIAMRGKNPAVLAVELLNPYNGIDASHNERHLIRDVQGQPLRRGHLRGRHLRHRPDRERPLQSVVEHEAAPVPMAAGARRGVHLRPQRLAVRLQHVLLRLQHRLQVHPNHAGACATATSWASARTIATPPWSSRTAPRWRC